MILMIAIVPVASVSWSHGIGNDPRRQSLMQRLPECCQPHCLLVLEGRSLQLRQCLGCMIGAAASPSTLTLQTTQSYLCAVGLSH